MHLDTRTLAYTLDTFFHGYLQTVISTFKPVPILPYLTPISYRG